MVRTTLRLTLRTLLLSLYVPEEVTRLVGEQLEFPIKGGGTGIYDQTSHLQSWDTNCLGKGSPIYRARLKDGPQVV